MPPIEPIELDAATGAAAELLGELAGRGTQPGPMVRVMANAPVVLLLTGAFNSGRRDRSRRRPRVPERKESCVSTYLTWAAATGAAGCGRCATAV